MENEIINTEVMEDMTGELIEEECVKTDRKLFATFGLGALVAVGGIIFYKKVARPFIAKLQEKKAQATSESAETKTDDENGTEGS